MLDAVDRQLVQKLAIDALQTSDMLAQQLNVSASTVRRRLRRLAQRKIVRIAALIDPAKVGFPLTGIIAFTVAHDQLGSVTKMLAKRPEVKWVSTITGRFDILAWVCFSSTEELSVFAERVIPGMKGVTHAETFVCLRAEKGNYVVWREVHQLVTLDATDRRLIQKLGADASQTSEMLAKQIDVSPATVRRRLRRLVQGKILRIAALVQPAKAGFPVTCMVAFNVAHDRLTSVAKALAERPDIKRVSITAGRFDILAWACFHSTEELSAFAETVVPGLQGVTRTETFLCLHVEKGKYAVWADGPASAPYSYT